MKKILLMLLLFFGLVSVNAATYDDTFYSGDWIPNIYINKVKSGVIHYRQARFIRKKSDNGIAYCIEPFEDMKYDDKYKSYTSEYAKRLGMSEEKWQKINLIAYYGYGYQNHKDAKWYAITQVMIWKEVDKNANFYFTDKLNGTKINKYDNEINEINNLVNTHKKLPSFVNKTYTFSIDSENKLVDTNKVLEYYNVSSDNKNINLDKKNNTLTINTTKEISTSIFLEQKFNNYNRNTIVFIDNKYQNLMAPGNVTSIKAKFDINVVGGTIKITKVDFDTEKKEPLGEGILIGSTYNILNEQNEIVDTLVIDNNYEAISKLLPLGKYKIKETKSMNGYKLDKTEYEVSIDSQDNNKELILKNEVIKSKIKILKYYDQKLEKGISFEIYNKYGELVDTVTTNEFGEITKELYYGTYTFHQLNSTKNYLCVDDFEVTINESSENIIRMELHDEKFSSKLLIIKKDAKTGKIIKEETIFRIYDTINKKYIEVDGSIDLKTINGILKIDKISAGEYEIEEIKAPKGYIRDNNKKKFIIDDGNIFKYEDDYPVYEITFDNEKIVVDVPNTGQNHIEKQVYVLENRKKVIRLK